MCWFSMAKYLMFAFNFVLFAAGAATLGLGIYISESTNGSVELIGVEISENGSYVLIAAGSIALIVGFLGCCGASKESTCLLGLYFTCVLVIVILQIAVGIWALVEYENIGGLVNDGLHALIITNEDDQATLQEIEKQFHCCGRNGTSEDLCEDWEGFTNPLGCECENTAENCVNITTTSCTATNSTYIYNMNCEEAIVEFIENNMTIIAGIGLGIGLLEIFGLIFSMCMCQALKQSKGNKVQAVSL